jgi:hypothetical protein
MEHSLAWLSEQGHPSTRKDIIRWWEARRLGFNSIIGAVGVASWSLVLVAGSAAVKPGEDFQERLMMIAGPLVYCIFANICYTFGWIVDAVFLHGDATNAAVQVRIDFFGGSYRATRSVGCGGVAHHCVHRTKTRLIASEPGPLLRSEVRRPTPAFPC